MKRSLMIVLMLSFVLLAAGHDSIPNLYSPRLSIFTSGQPTLFGYRELAGMGVQTVINVLPEEECIPGEAEIVNGYDMEYYQLSFEPSVLDSLLVEEFSYVLNSAEKPLLIHCSTGNHVGGIWLAYRVTIEGASIPVAVEEGRRIGMNAGMEHAVLYWISHQNEERTSQ